MLSSLPNSPSKQEVMTSLIIDTSTDLCLIAVANGDKILSEEIFPHNNLLSKKLLPSIQKLLKMNGIRPSELSYIAAGIGPGSYTGTRLGASVAKSLSFGLNINVKPFHSPLAFLPDCQGSFAFLIPTRANLYFILQGIYRSDGILEQSAALIPANALSLKTQGTDFLIHFSTHALPLELKEKTAFNASPNLLALSKFLSSAQTLPPENIELQYLHTPF